MSGRPLAIIKGAGDLATGVALRLHHAGFRLVMTEVAEPTPVRRTVALAEAVYEGKATVEDLRAVLAQEAGGAEEILEGGGIAVLVDPQALCRERLQPDLLVDAVMAKRNLGTRIDDAPAVVALGPGFEAGVDVRAVVETNRGHNLGRVLYSGSAQPNTGVPGEVGGASAERVLRAPAEGKFTGVAGIGDRVAAGETVAFVGEAPVKSAVAGVLRGLLRSGLQVSEGFKVGDVDPRARVEHCYTVSDKALSVGGGVLEAAGNLLGCFRGRS